MMSRQHVVPSQGLTPLETQDFEVLEDDGMEWTTRLDISCGK